MLGVPDQITALLFDLDGVLTDTASVHFAAWRDTFDPILAAHKQPGFGEQDYSTYVDGKPRADGVRSFLRSRGIDLPDGSTDDTGSDTVYGVGNAKNQRVRTLLRRDGVEVYPGSRRYLEQARATGLRRAVVSSSANTAEVLKVTGLDALIEQRVDGITLLTEQLPGKPSPASFLAGAKLLDAEPAHAAVFEDAVAGVEAGRAGQFGYVIGVNRLDQRHGDQLRAHGADRVVHDLGELL